MTANVKNDAMEDDEWICELVEFKPTQVKLKTPDRDRDESESHARDPMAEVQDKLDLKDFAEIMIRALLAHGGQRTVAYVDEDCCVRFGKAGKYDQWLNLRNLYVEYQSLTRGDQNEWLRRTVVGILNWMELPADFEDVKPDLLPAICSTFFPDRMLLTAEPQGVPSSMIPATIRVSEHLVACLVYDMPNKMQFITPENLSTWGVSLDEAFEVAKQNLEVQECAVKEFDRHLVTFVSGDGFDAARMLMIDRIRSFGFSGDPVALPVTRDSLFLTGSNDEDGLRMMAELAENSLQKARPVCAIPHRLNGDTWEEWMPPTESPMFNRFRALRLRQLSDLYAAQHSLLNRIFDHTGTVGFVARLTVGEEYGHMLSYCVWSKDVPTWLPEAEFVGFFRADTGVVGGLVPWDRVCATVGNLMKCTDLYPVRWFVDDFPTAEQFEAMGAAPTVGYSPKVQRHDPKVIEKR